MSDPIVTERQRSGSGVSPPPLRPSSPPPNRPPPPTPGSQPTPVINEVTRAQRFLNATNRGSAAAKRTRRNMGRAITQTTDKIVDVITGEKSKTDFLRRDQRFLELINDNANDERFSAIVATARDDRNTMQNAVKSGIQDWTVLAETCSDVTEKMLDAIKLVRNNEGKSRLANPTVTKTLDNTSGALDDAKLLLPPSEHAEFAKRLNGLQVRLAKLPDPKQDKGGAQAKTLGNDAVTLSDDIAKAIIRNDDRKNRLQAALAPLRLRLAALPDTAAMDARLAVSELLTRADNAIFGYDFAGAETAIEDATVALNKLKAPSPGEIPRTGTLLEDLKVQLNRTNDLQTRGGNLPKPVGPQLFSRTGAATQQLEAIKYSLEKVGGEVAADASRIIKECKAALDAVASTITGYDEFQKQREVQNTEFTKQRQRIQFQVQSFYQKQGVAGSGDGALLTRVADVASRWATALTNSISLDELNLAAYVDELNEIATELSTTKADPEKLAVEKAINRYKAAWAELAKAASAVIEADSDKAITLGLMSKPPLLEKAAEPLIGEKCTLPSAERVTKLDDVTRQVTELTAKAAEFDPKSIAFEINALRERCEDLINGYKRRIQVVLDDIDVERKKVISIGTNKTERDGLTKYGATLLSDLDTIAAPLVAKDAGLLGDVHHELVGFGKRVVDFEALGPNGKADKSMPDFASLQKRIDTLTKTLTTDSRFTPRAEMTKPWVDELNKLNDNLTGHDPRAVDTALTRIEGLVTTAKGVAKTERKAATESALKLKNLAADIVSAKGRFAVLSQDCPTYAADLDKRLLKLANEITAADKPNEKDAKALIDEVEKALLTNPSGVNARVTGEKTAKEGEQKRQAAAFALEKLKNVDIALLEEKAGKLKGEPRKALFKQIKDLRTATDGALKTLEINGDVAAATTMAEAIADRIKRAADAPLGSSTRARNNLPTVEQRWKDAVSTLVSNMDRVPELVKAECAGHDDALKAADALAAQLIEPAKAIFRPNAFEAMIKRIQASDQDGALSAREDALREVRRIRKLMESDSRVRMLSAVPFKGGALPFPEIGNALWDLETNLLTSG